MRLPVVVAEQASQAAPTLQFSRFTGREIRFDELVLQPLVIPFFVVVSAELVNRPPE